MKVVSTNSQGKFREIQGGFFSKKEISWVRDYKAGSKSKIERLPVIRLYPDKKYQEILGFGGAFTDGACYMINELDKDGIDNVLNEFFSPSGLALNVGRTTVAQCDFGRECYSYNDTPFDVEMKNFSIDYDREYIIPVIKKACEINPDLFLLSSPWSPPGWMKTGGMMTGGWMLNKYLEAYANYYLRYIQEYAKAGVKINALTTQNETETDQLSLMPACYWHPETELMFIRDYLVPLLRKNGIDAEVWIMDHNYIMWRRAKWMLDDPCLKESVKGIAFHPYEGLPESMSIIHDAHPDVDIHLTEIGLRKDEGYLTKWCEISKSFTEMLRNWSKSLFCWNIALDENGRPNIGPFIGVGGMVTIDSETREISYSAQYYAMGQYSKFIKRGACRIGSEGNYNDISHVAFINPDGEYVVVITNPGPAVEVSLDVVDRYSIIRLPEDSVSTIIFK